jgi:hypothetical protein
MIEVTPLWRQYIARATDEHIRADEQMTVAVDGHFVYGRMGKLAFSGDASTRATHILSTHLVESERVSRR